MTATTRNITIEQGAAFSTTLSVGAGKAGDAVTAKIRAGFGGDLLATFAGEIEDETLTISLTAAQTAALVAPTGTPDDLRDVVIGQYDAVSVDGDDVETRHLQGRVTLSRKAST